MARLVEGQDAYVDDAFGAAHRAHASIVGPPQTLPSAAGRLLQQEVEVLLGLREHPKRPFIAVLGGAKVSDKIGVIDALLQVVDGIAIGGGMCFTFLAAQGNPIGDSLFEPDQVDECRRLLAGGKPIHLPEDVVGLAPDGTVATYGTRLPDGVKGLDIGPGLGGRLRRPRPRRPHGVLERARWGCSRTSASPPAPARWPRPWPTPGRSPSSVAATRRRRWPPSGWPTTSTTCRPAAGRRSSCWSWATCPASRRSGSRRPERPRAGGTAVMAAAADPSSRGNWKMHFNHFDAIQFVQKLSYLLDKDDLADVDVSIHPPFTDLRSVQTLLDADRIPFALGAQHCHWEDKGAFTGEVAPVVPGQARRAPT